MYRILYNDSTIFDPYGNDNEVVTNASMSVEINAAAYMDFTMSRPHPLYNTISERDGVVTLYWDSDILFQGVIESIDMDLYGNKSVSCVSALDYLNDTVVRPYSTIAGEQKLTAPSSVNGYFQWLIDQHNKHVLDSRKYFYVGVNQGANLKNNNFIYRSATNNPTTASEISDKLLDELGGYLTMRYVDGRYVLDLYSDPSKMNTQIIDFGVNITNFSKTIDTKDQYTALVLKGGSPESSGDDGITTVGDPIDISNVPDGGTRFDSTILKHGDVIYDPVAVSRYGYKEEAYEDSTITDVDTLLKAGIAALNKRKNPQIRLDIKAVDLSMFVEGYTHLNVGDVVRVRSAVHNTDEYLMVNSISLDLNDPGQSEYSIGQVYDSLTGQQSGFFRSLNAGINSSMDSIASLDQTTKDQAVKIGSVTRVANKAQETANSASSKADNAQKSANNAQQTANASQKRADTVAQDLETARQEAQNNFDKANAAANAAQSKADSVGNDLDTFRTETNTTVQNVRDSVSKTQSDVDAVTKKASDLSDDLDATKATVSQTVTEFGEVKTTATNAASKADQSLQVSTQASQTATAASQKATSAYNDAQTAVSQSSEAVQTANSVSLSLKTDYQTKADADAKYATQSSLTATSDQIKSEVSKTYATKATVDALENIANNAVQTWMGTGAPTLNNKPASDWNTATLKAQHSGDIYYDTNTGYSYRFGSSDGSTYSWALIKDTDISKAIADAAKAQKTADSATSGVSELKSSIPVTYATKTELTQKADSITSRVEEVAQAGTTTSNKVTQLEQTASGLQSTVNEQSQKLDQQATTISQVSQKADSISTSLSQTNKNLDALSLNMIKNPGFETGDFTNWSHTDLSKINRLFVNTENPLSGTYKAEIWFPSADDFYLSANPMSSVAKYHTYEISCWIWSDEDVTIRLGFHAGAWDTTNQLSVSRSTAWQRISTTCKFQRAYSNVTPRIVFPGPIYYPFRVRLDNFDVRDITEGVEASGTANSALSKASTLEQTVDGLNVTISGLQRTANTASSNAANAQNRVGNLETCIKMTTDGVRVGKIDNGNFSGYSALVNSAGSFDVLDGSSKTIAKFSKDGLDVSAGDSESMFIGMIPDVIPYGYIGSTPSFGDHFDDHYEMDRHSGIMMGFGTGESLDLVNDFGSIDIIADDHVNILAKKGYVTINGVDVRGAGVVLFDKDDGNNYASVDILSGYNFGYFNYIMCFFKTNDGQYFGGTAYHPNGKTYNFTTMGGASTNMSYIKGTQWAFNGTKATRKTSFEIGPGYSMNVNNDIAHIVAILGFDFYH